MTQNIITRLIVCNIGHIFAVEQDIEQRCAKDMDTSVPHNSLNIEPLTGFDGVEADHSYFIIDRDIGQKMCTEEIDNSLQPFCPYKIDVPLSTLDNTETSTYFR